VVAGLKKDFRIINMTVSPSMVRDTAELFYMPNQRKVRRQFPASRRTALLSLRCSRDGHSLTTNDVQISLRYLAWYFLNIDVQVRSSRRAAARSACLTNHSRPQAGNHDSIEDARAALALYRKYEQIEAEGAVRCQLTLRCQHSYLTPDAPQVESAIGKLYAEGHAYNFKAPEDGSVSPLFQSQASQ